MKVSRVKRKVKIIVFGVCLGFGLAAIQIILQIDKDVFMTGYWVAALIFLTGVLLVNMLYNISYQRRMKQIAPLLEAGKPQEYVAGVERLLEACRAAEGTKPIIIAFKEQLPAIADHCSPCRPELLGGGWKETLSALGLGLYDPPQEAYLNAEGRCLDAALIQMDRRVGKPVEPEVL